MATNRELLEELAEARDIDIAYAIVSAALAIIDELEGLREDRQRQSQELIQAIFSAAGYS